MNRKVDGSRPMRSHSSSTQPTCSTNFSAGAFAKIPSARRAARRIAGSAPPPTSTGIRRRGRGPDGERRQVVDGALVRERLAAPRLRQDPEDLVHGRAATARVGAEPRVLDLGPAEPEAQDQPAVAQQLDGRRILRQAERVVHRGEDRRPCRSRSATSPARAPRRRPAARACTRRRRSGAPSSTPTRSRAAPPRPPGGRCRRRSRVQSVSPGRSCALRSPKPSPMAATIANNATRARRPCPVRCCATFAASPKEPRDRARRAPPHAVVRGRDPPVPRGQGRLLPHGARQPGAGGRSGGVRGHPVLPGRRVVHRRGPRARAVRRRRARAVRDPDDRRAPPPGGAGGRVPLRAGGVTRCA